MQNDALVHESQSYVGISPTANLMTGRSVPVNRYIVAASGTIDVGTRRPRLVRLPARDLPGPADGRCHVQRHVRTRLVRAGVPDDLLPQVAQMRCVRDRLCGSGVRGGRRHPQAAGLPRSPVHCGGLRPARGASGHLVLPVGAHGLRVCGRGRDTGPRPQVGLHRTGVRCPRGNLEDVSLCPLADRRHRRRCHRSGGRRPGHLVHVPLGPVLQGAGT